LSAAKTRAGLGGQSFHRRRCFSCLAWLGSPQICSIIEHGCQIAHAPVEILCISFGERSPRPARFASDPPPQGPLQGRVRGATASFNFLIRISNSQRQASAFSRRDAPEVCTNVVPRKTEGAGNSCCHRHWRIKVLSARSGRHASASLAPATGVRTTRLCRPRKASFVSRAAHRSRGSTRPAIAVARLTLSRPPHPVRYVRDDRDTPVLLERDGAGGAIDLGWSSRVGKRDIFHKGTGQSKTLICPGPGNSFAGCVTGGGCRVLAEAARTNEQASAMA